MIIDLLVELSSMWLETDRHFSHFIAIKNKYNPENVNTT